MRVCCSLLIIVFSTVGSAVHGGMISVDLDPFTAGIQSELTVSRGTGFLVDVVFTASNETSFDTVNLDLSFNQSGNAVLVGLEAFLPVTQGTIGFLADSLNFDHIAQGVTNPNLPLQLDSLSPDAGFDSNLGGVFFSSTNGSVLTPYEIPAGASVTLFRAAFLANSLGESFIAPTLDVSTGAGFELTNGGPAYLNGTSAAFSGGSINGATVISVPEASSIFIWLSLVVSVCVAAPRELFRREPAMITE